MSIDLAEKISYFSLLKSILTPINFYDIEILLKNKNVIEKNKKVIFFNWGRNALFALFKQLPFKTIHFPAFICSVTTDAALAAGKKVELIDVDKETFNLDINKLKNKNIDCLLVLHAFGNPIDVERVKKILPKAYVIEDCAHAFFSKIKNKQVGKLGNAALFSLYKQTLNLNGAVLAADKNFKPDQKEELTVDLKKRIFIRTKGIHQYYLNKLKKSYLPKIVKEKFTDQLKPNKLVLNLFKQGFEKLEGEVEKRRKLAPAYFALTNKSKYFLPQKIEKNAQPSFYQFVVRLKPQYINLRDKILMNLRKKGIFLDRLWYDAPIAQKHFAKSQKICPKALMLSQSVISLPIRSDFDSSKISYLFKELENTAKENL